MRLYLVLEQMGISAGSRGERRLHKNSTALSLRYGAIGQLCDKRGTPKGGVDLEPRTQLIKILLDSTAGEDERDDAAMDLADFDGNDVVQALFAVATDKTYRSDMVKGSCGESLATIWIRTRKVDLTILHQLEGIALQEAVGLIKGNRPEWLFLD